MHSNLISSKGQIIIPKILRAARHWNADTRLKVQNTPEGILLKHISPAKKTALKSGLKAIRLRLAYVGPVLSLADMDAAVLLEASRMRRKLPAKSSN